MPRGFWLTNLAASRYLFQNEKTKSRQSKAIEGNCLFRIFFSNNNNDIPYLIPFSLHYKLKVNCNSSNPFVFSVAIFSSTFYLAPWSGFWLTGNFLQYKSKSLVSMILRMTACHAEKSQRHYSPILQGYKLFLNDYQRRAHRSLILRQKNRSHVSFQTQNLIAERCANQFLIASFLPWWNILLNTSQKSYCIFIPRTQRSIYRYKPYLGGDKATQTPAQ